MASSADQSYLEGARRGGDHLPMEDTEVFRRYVEIADWAWAVAHKWPPTARNTRGEQLIRAADSVGANLVEGDGRRSGPDGLRFFYIARASAREARYWIQRAIARKLIGSEEGASKTNEIEVATRMLNGLINYRKTKLSDRVAEGPTASYQSRVDPFDDSHDLQP